jgi:hypothetical protein
MTIVLVVLCVAVFVAAYFLIWRNRAPKFHGLSENDFVRVSEGVVHPALETACQEMLRIVSDRVTKFYTTVARSSAYSLPVGQTYDYTNLHLTDLVHEIEVVDALPNGARGTIVQEGSGPIKMTLVRHTLDDVIYFQHELAHSLSWRYSELRDQCALDPRGHWTVMFDPFGSH